MKKIVIFLFFVQLIFLSSLGICETDVVIWNSQGELLTNLYDRPSINGIILGSYYDTAEVIVLEANEDWVLARIGEQTGYLESNNIGASNPRKGVQLMGARVASQRFEDMLPAYETPDKSSEIVKYLPNGYYVWVIGYLPDHWAYVEFQDKITTKYAYVNVDANELADVTKEPPEHPLYKGAFLCIEEGYQYYFEGAMPSQLQCAFSNSVLNDNQVIFGAISSWDSKKAAVVLRNESQITLYIMSKEDNEWEIVATNDTIYHIDDDFRNNLVFSGPYELTFGLPWFDCYAMCVVESDILGNWNLKLISLYGDQNDPLYSRDIQIEPCENGLHFYGSVQARNQMSQNFDVVVEGDYMPTLESPLFKRLNMDKIRKTIINAIPEAFQ